MKERKELLKSYLKRLGEGEELERVRADFTEAFRDVDPTEIMQAEQEMLAEGTPQAAPGYYRIQSGALNGQAIDIHFVNASKESLGTDKVNVSSHAKASESITMVQDAIEQAALWRDEFGSQQERLEHAVRNTDNTSQNTQSAESGIRDTNMNMEMVLYSTNRILVHASQSILAQYNDDAKAVLEILK